MDASYECTARTTAATIQACDKLTEHFYGLFFTINIICLSTFFYMYKPIPNFDHVSKSIVNHPPVITIFIIFL